VSAVYKYTMFKLAVFFERKKKPVICDVNKLLFFSYGGKKQFKTTNAVVGLHTDIM